MALNKAIGTFNTPASAGTVSVTGLSFQPDLVFFFGAFVDASVPDIHMVSFFGAMDGDGNQWASSGASQSVLSTSNTSRGFFDNHCIYGPNFAGSSAQFAADFDSMDSGGFTVDFTTTQGSSYVVQYVALGGLPDVEVGVGTAPTVSGGAETYTVGFEPSCLIVGSNILAVDTVTTANVMTLGFGTDTDEYGISWLDSDNVATTVAVRSHGDSIIGYLLGEPTEIDINIESFNATNFKLEASANTATFPFGYVAIGGVDADVGYSIMPATDTTKSVTGVGFEPEVIFGLSTNDTAFFDDMNIHAISCIGASIGAGSGECESFISYSLHNQATSSAGRTSVSNSFLTTLDATFWGVLMDSIDTDGFTVDANGMTLAIYFGHLCLAEAAGDTLPSLTYRQLRQMGS